MRYGEVVPTSTESKPISLLLPSHERITLIEFGYAAGRGGVGKLSRRPGTPNFVHLLLFLESITLVGSVHAAERGGVGKLSRRSGTPNFVPCFLSLTRE